MVEHFVPNRSTLSVFVDFDNTIQTLNQLRITSTIDEANVIEGRDI